MSKLTITIETDADIADKDLYAIGNIATKKIFRDLEPYWKGATVQSSSIRVTDSGTKVLVPATK